MGFYYGFGNAEKDRSADFFIVDFFLHDANLFARKQVRKFGAPIGFEHIFHRTEYHERRTFRTFKDKVACKSVANKNVAFVIHNVSAFDIADKVYLFIFFQEFVCLNVHGNTFGFFRTVICKAYAGIFNAEHSFNVNRAHTRKKVKHFGGTFDIRAAVRKDKFTVNGANCRCKSRTFYSFYATDKES